MSRLLTRIFMASVVVATVACVPAPLSRSPSPTPALTTLNVVNLPFIAFAPFWIGVEEGLFREQGIDVNLVNMTTQPDTIPALLAGQVDVVSGQVSASMFNLVARGGQAKLVADKGYIDANACDNIALIARHDLLPPGTQPSADVLRIRKISVIPGSWNDYLADKVLASVGLTTSDFADNVQVPSTSAVQAMDSGQIDLIVQNEPWVTRLIAAGHTPILNPTHEVLADAESAVVMFGPRLLGSNTDLGNRFMVAYLEAVRRYNEGKTDRNVAILAHYTQLDPALLRQMCWPAIRNDGSINVDSVLDFQTWAVQKGLVQTPVTAEQLIDTSFVSAANTRLGQP